MRTRYAFSGIFLVRPFDQFDEDDFPWQLYEYSVDSTKETNMGEINVEAWRRSIFSPG